MEPKFSIIIPTRNRVEYLKGAIASVLDCGYESYELIVSDNYSTDGTLEYLESLSFPQLRVIRPEKPLAMVDHFDWVLRQAEGEWITVFGDDDGLLPYFFSFSEYLITRWGDQLEVIYGPRAYYFWPGLTDLYGKVVVDYSASSEVAVIDSGKALRSLVFGQGNYFDSPQFYTGSLFRRRLVDRIIKRHQDGRIFNSITPDANSTALILLNTDRILRVGIPLVWVGSSAKSTGAQSAISMASDGTDGDIIGDFKRLNERAGIQIDERFRTFYVVEGCQKVYFLEALLQASKANHYGWERRYNDLVTRHKMFASIYNEWCKRKRKGLRTRGYDQLLSDNDIRLFYVRAVSLYLAVVNIPKWIHLKLQKRLSFLGFMQKPPVRYKSDDRSGHETINSVNHCFAQGEMRQRVDALIERMKQGA